MLNALLSKFGARPRDKINESQMITPLSVGSEESSNDSSIISSTQSSEETGLQFNKAQCVQNSRKNNFRKLPNFDTDVPKLKLNSLAY